MNFCNNLQKLRKKLNMSQEQLAENLGVTRQSVSKWESGASYPEMDKLVALCKIFNCELDDLVNKNIDEVKDLTSSKKIIGNFFKSVGDGITKTIRMIENFSFKELIKFICQLLIIVVVILICSIPFTLIGDIVSSAFSDSSIYPVVSSFCNFIIAILYSSFAIIAFFYIYKVKFLDNIVEVDANEESDKNDNKESLNIEKKRIVKKDSITIKKDGLSILDFLMTLCIWFIKFIFIVFMFFILFTVVVSTIGLILLIGLICKGLLLLGPILIALSFVVFCIAILEILFNFIVNKKTNFKRIFITCISTIVVASIGVGLTIGYFCNIEIVNKAPDKYKIVTKEEIVPMNDKLFVHDSYYGDIEYIEDNSFENNVKISVDYYNYINSINIKRDDDTKGSVYVSVESPESLKINKFVDEIIRNLKNKKFYNYENLSNVKIKVVASSENIEKIKHNREVEFEDDSDDCEDCYEE